MGLGSVVGRVVFWVVRVDVFFSFGVEIASVVLRSLRGRGRAGGLGVELELEADGCLWRVGGGSWRRRGENARLARWE